MRGQYLARFLLNVEKPMFRTAFMSSINSSTPAMLSYYSNLLNNSTSSSATSSTSTSTGSSTSQSSEDALESLRSYAQEVVARSKGGLMRALSGASSQSTSSLFSAGSQQSSNSAAIQLPDVSSLDRDEAAKLLVQVQKLEDAGLSDSIGFSGSNGNQSTDSLQTYRQWLQDKGGISVYA